MLFFVRLTAAMMLAAGAANAEPVTFSAADGVTVHAHHEGQSDRVLIVLFHQAGSNLHEYDPIVQQLHEMGFNTLAVSQRSGGARFGGVNETADGAGGAPGYLDAYPDMEAALEYAVNKSGRVVVWGSSYSASLVFKLAAEHPKGVVGVLSFSPGEYFGSGFSVADAAARVKAPVFVTSASDAGEIAAAKAIVATVPGDATQYVPKRGVHGSSTLRYDENAKGAADNWQAVRAFLAPLQ